MKPKNELHDPFQPDQGHADPRNVPHNDGSTGHHPNQEFIDNTESPDIEDAAEKKKHPLWNQ